MTDPYVYGITLDPSGGYIYWIHAYDNDGEGIYRSNLDGTGQTQVVNVNS